MQTSVICKLTLLSKSIEDEQEEEWLQLKVDKNKAHKPLKLICHTNIICIFQSMWEIICDTETISDESPHLPISVYSESEKNSEKERRMLTQVII